MSYLLFLLFQTIPDFTISHSPQDAKVAQKVLKFAEVELPRTSQDLGLTQSRQSRDFGTEGVLGQMVRKGLAGRVRLPAQAPLKIHIQIVSSSTEIKNIQGFPDWGIGCAIPPQKTIILKSPRIIKYPVPLKSLVAHEISHVVLGNLCKNTKIPRWFDEGVAMYESREWEVGESMWLSWANFTRSLLPLSSLEYAFPKEYKKARLAYIESFSAISFIINEFGRETLKEIILSCKETHSFDQAIKNTLGLTYLDFAKEWKKWVERRYTGFNIFFSSFFPGGLLLIIFFIALSLKIKQKKKIKQDNEEEIYPEGST